MSTQNTETPWELIRAIESYLGIKFTYDMASSKENAKAPHFFTEEFNTLDPKMKWPRTTGWCWLNPTFRNLSKWTAKVFEEYKQGSQIVTIWPVSGDLNCIPAWKHAKVHIIHGRVWPLVRSCMVCQWDLNIKPTIEGLRWDKKTLTRMW